MKFSQTDSCLLSFKAFVFSLIFLFSGVQNILATQQERVNILVLPAKVTSFDEKTSLEKDFDQYLQSAFDKTNVTFLQREEAEQLVDYTQSWPPLPETVPHQKPFSEYTYLAAGNLTELGGKIRIDYKITNLDLPIEAKHFSVSANNRQELVLATKKLASLILAYTSKQDIIYSIAPSGNKIIDSGAILKNITAKPGDLYDPAILRTDLKNVYKMGYFEDIQIDVKQTPEGKAVFFTVVEKPVITSLNITGTDQVKEEDVKGILTIKVQDVLNQNQIAKNSEAIQLFYKSKGYYNTTVATEITTPTPATVGLRFIIDEGEKIYIKEINFEGNQAFDDKTLKKEMQTGEKGLFTWLTQSGLLDYDKLNQDSSRILTFYGNQGYLDAKIGEPIVTQKEEWLYITFAVEEGTQYKVGKVSLDGDLLGEKDSVYKQLKIPQETYVSRSILREDLLKITDFFAEKGYANAQVHPKIKRGTADDVLDISLQIDKGEPVYINRIEITGNTRTRENVIRRDLKVEEGGILNAKALRESAQKLLYLEFFEDVNITPEPSFNQNTVDILVEVKEKSTGQFSIGAGYSSVDKLVFTGEVSENNFLGTGNTLSVSTNLSSESTQYNIRYSDPRFRDSYLSYSVNLFKMEREYDDYTKKSTGGSLQLGYPIWRNWRGYANYSFTDSDLTKISEDASYIIRKSADIHTTSALKFTVRQDTRNRQFGATRGTRHTLTVTYAGGPLGGDSQYTSIEGSTSWYFPFFSNWAFHVKGTAGQVFEKEDDSLPIYERFFLGGLKSIRGFDYADISPTDTETGENIGGDKMWYTNFEIIIPLFGEQGVKAVVFYDMGNVFNDDEDWSFDEIKQSAGLGIRWYSPMGPMRLEWGYPADTRHTGCNSIPPEVLCLRPARQQQCLVCGTAWQHENNLPCSSE